MVNCLLSPTCYIYRQIKICPKLNIDQQLIYCINYIHWRYRQSINGKTLEKNSFLGTNEAMRQRTQQLAEIETVTLNHYNQGAEAFWQGTKEHDVTQNYVAFLSSFPKEKILDILDFGCGPGRDVKYFQSLGHRPIGLDGSEVFCDMALNIQVVRFFIRNF